MKKLLLLLLLPIFTLAQFNPEKVCSLDEQEARKYADELVSLSAQKFRFLKVENRTQNETFVYILDSVTDEQLKTAESYRKFENIEFAFAVSMKDKNADLKIPGTKAYRLERVYGQFLNLFPFWQKYYVPDATLENYKDYRKKEYRKGNFFIKFIDDDDGYWLMNVFSCQ